MKRKFLTVLLAVLATFCMAFALSACDFGGSKTNGTQQSGTQQGGTQQSGGTQTPDEGGQGGGTRPASVGLQYSLNSEETAYSVVGIGDCKDEDIVIPAVHLGKPVTSIGESAFEGCSGLTKVTVPESVTSIGNSAFRGCSGLTKVTIGSGVTSIGESAFEGCSALTEITIPDSVTSIGYAAFKECNNLKNITIPIVGNGSNETYFGYIFGAESSFGNAMCVPTSLKKVTITGGTSIGDFAFQACRGLTEVTIGSGVTSIGYGAFYNCSGLQKVHITDLVAWCNISFDGIGVNPLRYAHHLYMDGKEIKTLEIPSGVTSIGSAFSGCSGLTGITIPDSVTSIGENAFCNCSGLTEITIGSGVTSIGDYAFGGCYKLIEVWNYSGLNIQAGESDHGYIADYAEHVYTDDTPSKQTVVNDYIFYEEGEESYLLGYVGTETKLTLPEHSPTGKNYAIYRYAFYDCSGLTEIKIPDSVTSIGDSAFFGCSGLEKFIVEADNTAYSSQDGVLYDKEQTKILFVPQAIKGAVTIPDGVTEIGGSAFSGRDGLTEITIPDSVTEIGQGAFFGCSGLTEITIGSGVTSIGYEAFHGCSGLTEITIGSGVTSIEQWAFAYCSGLKKAYFKNPKGWQVNGNVVAGLDDPETAAGYLTDTYYNYDWKRYD